MIAEIFLVLAGHDSSLFPKDHTIHPAFTSLLHPGEQQCLESLGLIACRYRKIKRSCAKLSRLPSRYICALCAALNSILKDEYEVVILETEERVLRRDPGLVASGSFVPLSSIRAIFAEWDAPFAALCSLVDQLEAQKHWNPGPLMDLLLRRSHTGVHRVADILSRLSVAVQSVWRTQLTVFLVHGSLSSTEPLANEKYQLLEGSMPSCVSAQAKDSIAYVGRAVGTVKAASWHKQPPRDLALEHTQMLQVVLPEDQLSFDRVVDQIRTNVSEWLWLNVLTSKDVEDAVDSLANYFLLRNGEFSLSVIREIDRLKLSRLSSRSGPTSMIREQDLNLALLRASLGTAAQYDPSLSNIRFVLPSGPLLPLLPSLAQNRTQNHAIPSEANPATSFDDLLLGTSLDLTFKVTWPLDLFLHSSDLRIYGALFGYLSSLRKTHTRIHGCWTSLSNAQRARRRWTMLGEGGTTEDVEARRTLLRCGWGVVRDMEWFLNTVLGYAMSDVIDVEFRRLKEQLRRPTASTEEASRGVKHSSGQQSGAISQANAPEPDATKPAALPASASGAFISTTSHLDFTTLRNIHSKYLDRILTGCLLSNHALTAILRPIFEVCERFVAQVERWGGDVLPELLFEGSIAAGSDDGVGAMVKERWKIVAEVNDVLRAAPSDLNRLLIDTLKTFHTLLDSFYEQLSLSTSQQPLRVNNDSSISVLMQSASKVNISSFQHTFVRPRGGKGREDGEAKRHIERLLLRLDFNGGLSETRPGKATTKIDSESDILKQGGLT